MHIKTIQTKQQIINNTQDIKTTEGKNHSRHIKTTTTKQQIIKNNQDIETAGKNRDINNNQDIWRLPWLSNTFNISLVGQNPVLLWLSMNQPLFSLLLTSDYFQLTLTHPHIPKLCHSQVQAATVPRSQWAGNPTTAPVSRFSYEARRG